MGETVRRINGKPIPLPEGFRKYCMHISRLAALGASSSAIMHEIGNALTVISGNAQILLLKGKKVTPEDAATRHRRIQDHVERIQGAIDRVGSFSERAAGIQKKTTPLLSVKNALFAIERRCNNAGIKIETDLQNDQGQVVCDPTLLEFLIIELLYFFSDTNASSGRLVLFTDEECENWALTIRYYPPSGKPLTEWDISEDSEIFNLPVILHISNELNVQLFELDDQSYKGWKLVIPLE